MNVVFTISSSIYVFLLLFVFYSKKRINHPETKIFSKILLCTFTGTILEIINYYLLKIGLNKNDTIFVISTKLILIYYVFWTSYFSMYVNIISDRIKLNTLYKFTIPILSIIILMLKINYLNKLNLSIPTGYAVYLVYGVSFVYIILGIIKVVTTFKKRLIKKYLPLLTLIILSTIATIIQFIKPEILLMNFIHTIILYILYFTIENPDIKMMQQLELARDHAEKANRAKSDFLSSMSHEIRTPLNAIVGLSEDNLTYEEKLPQEVVENSHDIVNASQTLLEIVGNILDINKIEADKMEIVEAKYNLREEITNMCKVTTTRIGEKPIKFKLNISEDIPYELIGDKIKVKTIVNNLLTNAIKYTEKGEINLNIRCINDIKRNISRIIITCQDTGKGIKSEHIKRLFNKFDRLDVEKNTTTEGTGLGLAITKKLVEMMGGAINVESQYKMGSIFIVQLPQKISKLVGEEIEKEEIKIRDVKYEGKKILIVDDNKLNIKVAKKTLKDFNFELDECYDGIECLEKINNGNKYDLILMDIMMPNMNGEACIEELKKIEGFNTPVIALTADALNGAKEKYISEGFIDYIAKPFSKDQIKEKLENILKDKVIVKIPEKKLKNILN